MPVSGVAGTMGTEEARRGYRRKETPSRGIQAHPSREGRDDSAVRFADGRMFLVRAIVDDRTEPAKVVTVYRTTKVRKYWRSEP